jgi:hypothetical protein
MFPGKVARRDSRVPGQLLKAYTGVPPSPQSFPCLWPQARIEAQTWPVFLQSMLPTSKGTNEFSAVTSQRFEALKYGTTKRQERLK